MVEIRYNEKPLVFDFIYSQKEYIPAKYYEAGKDNANIELRYFIDLLKENEMLSKKADGMPLIWRVHYQCYYHKTSFTMVYDEDYGFVSFAVSNPKDRVTIAEIIKNLIEKKKEQIS